MKAPPVFLLIVAILSQAFAHEDDQLVPSTDVSCRARAWVRAPNLKPGNVLQGDVKVKLDGPCDEVSSYSLGLRFAERSWVKTPRKGVTLPVKLVDDFSTSCFQNSYWNRSIYEDVAVNRWSFYSGQENGTAWDQYESDMKSPELWVVREEERIAFETEYHLYDVPGGQEPAHDIVKSFALLVPSTNYPPAFENTFGGAISISGVSTIGAEHIYEYFVDVAFSNGTHRKIDAGYTSFDAVVTSTVDRGPVSVNATANRAKYSGQALGDNTSPDKFTLEVTFPDGMHFEQGSTNNITITSHQLGPGLQRALSIDYISTQVQHKRHWAANHAADNETAEELLRPGWLSRSELQPNIQVWDSMEPLFLENSNTNIPHFSTDAVVENGTLFSTEPVAAQFHVPARSYPSFGMYYQTLEAKMSIGLQVYNVSETRSPPGTALDDEEYDWTPTVRERFSYKGTENLEATIPIFFHHSEERSTTTGPNLVHYLSPEARAPVFVDPVSLPRLLQMTPEERDHLAPHCDAKIFAKSDEDVVKGRYYARGSKAPQAYYYVGNTWLKMVTRVDREGPQQKNILLNQS